MSRRMILAATLVLAFRGAAFSQHRGHGGGSPPRESPPPAEEPASPPGERPGAPGQDGGGSAPQAPHEGHDLPPPDRDAEAAAKEFGLELEVWKGLARLGNTAASWRKVPPEERRRITGDFVEKRAQAAQKARELTEHGADTDCEGLKTLRIYLGDERIIPILKKHEQTADHSSHQAGKPPPAGPGRKPGERRLRKDIADCKINWDGMHVPPPPVPADRHEGHGGTDGGAAHGGRSEGDGGGHASHGGGGDGPGGGAHSGHGGSEGGSSGGGESGHAGHEGAGSGSTHQAAIHGMHAGGAPAAGHAGHAGSQAHGAAHGGDSEGGHKGHAGAAGTVGHGEDHPDGSGHSASAGAGHGGAGHGGHAAGSGGAGHAGHSGSMAPGMLAGMSGHQGHGGGDSGIAHGGGHGASMPGSGHGAHGDGSLREGDHEAGHGSPHAASGHPMSGHEAHVSAQENVESGEHAGHKHPSAVATPAYQAKISPVVSIPAQAAPKPGEFLWRAGTRAPQSPRKSSWRWIFQAVLGASGLVLAVFLLRRRE